MRRRRPSGSRGARAALIGIDALVAKELSTAAAGMLVVWMGTQLAMIGFRSPLQPAVLATAAGSLALSRRLAADQRSTRSTWSRFDQLSA